MANIQDYEDLAVAVVLLALVLFGTFAALRSYRLRRIRAMREQTGAPRFPSDRAYNRLALARREADLLRGQGGNTEQADQLIALANRSLDSRDFNRAYDLAQSAHETLVKARREPRRGSPPTGEPAPASNHPMPPSAEAAPVAAPPLAKNRAEAQFQLRLFEQELAGAGKNAASAPGATEARELYVQAHAAFARGDYADAFRLSLRGRRRLGAHVESLGAGAAGAPAGATTKTDDPVETAESVAAAQRCPSCGYPTTSGDAFCRGCGTPRAGATCPQCGAPRAPSDTFCGKCGFRYS